jgi:pimeloyl-ACP methyl ester carboxylesterase
MTTTANVPTVVLVHGGFADASFWAPVIRELQASNVPILAPANPLRGLSTSRASSTRSTGPCSWSATHTAAR